MRTSLSNIAEYARLDKTSSEFTDSVKKLIDRLFTVLRDNMQIFKHSADPEMMADLYCRLANGYTNTPTLRITWLESLSNLHTQTKRFAEAAMCNLHIAAMISEYLNIVQPTPGLPNGCDSFVQVSPNILEESSIRDTSIVVSK